MMRQALIDLNKTNHPAMELYIPFRMTDDRINIVKKEGLSC